MTTTADLARAFLAVRQRIDTLSDNLKDATAEKDRLSDALVDALIVDGVESLAVDGHTIYTRTDMQCSKLGGVSSDEAVDVVRQMGLGDLVQTQVQPARIKSWVREQIAEAREKDPTASPDTILPKPFLATFRVFERAQAVARKK